MWRAGEGIHPGGVGLSMCRWERWRGKQTEELRTQPIEEEISMRKAIELSAFVFLLIGTLGLLMNEFVFDWGRTSTLIFPAADNSIRLKFPVTLKKGNLL